MAKHLLKVLIDRKNTGAEVLKEGTKQEWHYIPPCSSWSYLLHSTCYYTTTASDYYALTTTFHQVANGAIYYIPLATILLLLSTTTHLLLHSTNQLMRLPFHLPSDESETHVSACVRTCAAACNPHLKRKRCLDQCADRCGDECEVANLLKEQVVGILGGRV